MPLTSPPVSGVELGYAEITNANPLTTTSDSLVDVAGLSVSVVVPAGPVMLRFGAEWVYNLTALKSVYVVIYDVTASAVVVDGAWTSATASALLTPSMSRRHSPGAGARTYKVQWSRSGGGTANLSGIPTSPAWLQVVGL